MSTMQIKLLILIHRFFRDFTPFAPYIALYFAREGLSISEISIAFFIWSLTSIVLEIPTGILGDKYDRKSILVLAQFAKLCGFSVWLISSSFLGFVIGLILWGLASSLDSGTFQAFLYDVTKDFKSKNTFNDLYGKANVASFIGLFVATVLAAVLVQYSFEYLLIISLVGLSISLVALLIVPPTYKKISESDVNPLFSHKTVFKNFTYILDHKLLLTIFIIGVAAAGVKAPLDEYHALFFENRGMSLFMIGLIIASFELVKSIGAFFASKVRIGDYQQNYALIGMGVLFIIAAFAPIYISVALLLLMIMVDMILWISNDAAIQEKAIDSNRATLMSIKMFSGEIIALLMLGSFSVISRYYSVTYLYVVSGALLIGIAITLTLFSSSEYWKQQLSYRKND